MPTGWQSAVRKLHPGNGEGEQQDKNGSLFVHYKLGHAPHEASSRERPLGMPQAWLRPSKVSREEAKEDRPVLAAGLEGSRVRGTEEEYGEPDHHPTLRPKEGQSPGQIKLTDWIRTPWNLQLKFLSRNPFTTWNSRQLFPVTANNTQSQSSKVIWPSSRFMRLNATKLV